MIFTHIHFTDVILIAEVRNCYAALDFLVTASHIPTPFQFNVPLIKHNYLLFTITVKNKEGRGKEGEEREKEGERVREK